MHWNDFTQSGTWDKIAVLYIDAGGGVAGTTNNFQNNGHKITWPPSAPAEALLANKVTVEDKDLVLVSKKSNGMVRLLGAYSVSKLSDSPTLYQLDLFSMYGVVYARPRGRPTGYLMNKSEMPKL